MTAGPPDLAPDLARLTGVRSGKGSFYPQYRRSHERLTHAVEAMDSISRALVRTVEGPRGLLEEVARTAAAYLEADWTLLGLRDGHLTGARPRFVAVTPYGDAETDAERLPVLVRRELRGLRAGPATGPGASWVRVPMTLEGELVGTLSVRHGLPDGPDASDLSVLRILANQAAVGLHTSEQFQAGMALHRRAQQLYDDATAKASDLAARTAQLRHAEQQLHVATERELLDTERHRIARELHDSVTQVVLSAGMSVELARGDAEALGAAGAPLEARLADAKAMTQQAVEQLRRAIYALYQPHRETVATLPELLQEVTRHHDGRLAVQLRVEGGPVPLPGEVHHELTRAVAEALFNVAAHARATRVIVRLRYRPSELRVTVSDDGCGDPVQLARTLRLERSSATDGRHRGLVNIETRITELGGALAFRRSRLGGVRVELRLPLPLLLLTPGLTPGIIDGLTGPARVPSDRPAPGDASDRPTQEP